MVLEQSQEEQEKKKDYLFCVVDEQDIRKFLDGIYVSEKGFVVKD